MKINIKSDTNNKANRCPVDSTELKKDIANSSLLCGVCNRRYYVNADFDNKQKNRFSECDNNDDLITASSINNQGPILISSSHEFNDFKLNPVGEKEPSYDKVIKSKYGTDAK